MSKKFEDQKLTPLTENELGQIEGGFMEIQPPPSDDLTDMNYGCPSTAPGGNVKCTAPPASTPKISS